MPFLMSSAQHRGKLQGARHLAIADLVRSTSLLSPASVTYAPLSLLQPTCIPSVLDRNAFYLRFGFEHPCPRMIREGHLPVVLPLDVHDWTAAWSTERPRDRHR